MEKMSNDNPSQSHTSFLSQLLAISKQDIELSKDVIKAYRILMNHVRKCSSGRIQYLAECLLPGEADIGHAIEMEKTKEIYLEMQKSFSRMKEKLDESEQSRRIDELVEKKLNEQEKATTNMYDLLNDEEMGEEEPGSTRHVWEHSGKDDSEIQQRLSRQNVRRQHKENIRKLKEQVRETHDEKLSEIRNHMARFGTFFSNNMEEMVVGEKGEETGLITFRHLNGLVFTLDQMKNIILYSKLHSDIFCIFMTITYLIKSQESLSGVTTADCVNTLKRISTRNHLTEILRCRSSTFAISYILLTNPKDYVLDNLDHLARIDPYLFGMLDSVKGSMIPLNEENSNITIKQTPLFKIAQKKPNKFQFIVGAVSKAITSRIERNNSFLALNEFSRVYNVSSKIAVSILKSDGSRANITIPIDTPNQSYALVDVYEDGITYQLILPCNLKGNGDTVQMPSRYQSTVEASSSIYITGISWSSVEEADTHRVPTYLYQNNNPVYTRLRISNWHKIYHFSDFRFEYV